MFDTAELEKQLNAGKITIPDNHRVAFVTHANLNDKSVTAALAFKTGNNWQVGTVLDWSHDEGINAGFNVSWSK